MFDTIQVIMPHLMTMYHFCQWNSIQWQWPLVGLFVLKSSAHWKALCNKKNQMQCQCPTSREQKRGGIGKLLLDVVGGRYTEVRHAEFLLGAASFYIMYFHDSFPDWGSPAFPLWLHSSWSNLDDLYKWLMVREVSYTFRSHEAYKGAVYTGKWTMGMPHS